MACYAVLSRNTPYKSTENKAPGMVHLDSSPECGARFDVWDTMVGAEDFVLRIWPRSGRVRPGTDIRDFSRNRSFICLRWSWIRLLTVCSCKAEPSNDRPTDKLQCKSRMHLGCYWWSPKHRRQRTR